MTTRAVFDCMVFLQGAARPEGPAAACLNLVEHGACALFTSDEVLEEIRNVLSRDRIRPRFSTLTAETTDAFLARIE